LFEELSVLDNAFSRQVWTSPVIGTVSTIASPTVTATYGNFVSYYSLSYWYYHFYSINMYFQSFSTQSNLDLM
jgi:hypothetical protein